MFDRSGSRGVLIEALETVESRLIIVCPWLNCNGIDESLLDKIKACLDRGCQIDIGWGYLGDRWNFGKGWKYNALGDLQDLEEIYSDLFRLKLLGTHEIFLVCDDKFAFVGSHNFLASGNQSLEREVGIRTTDYEIIRGLIDHFDDAEVLESAEINPRLAASVKSLDEVEYLYGVIDENEIEFRDISMVVDEDEEEQEEEEESQEPVVSAEEFLRRYNEGERDFTGINLAGVDLSGNYFNDSKLNLSNANFNRASFMSVNLTGAKFRDADLSKSKLNSANLSEAKFINTDLSKAEIYSTNLEKAKFRNVKFKDNQLLEANFTEANLRGINFSISKVLYILNIGSPMPLNKPNFSGANLTNANLRYANFTNANLSQADLSKANFYFKPRP